MEGLGLAFESRPATSGATTPPGRREVGRVSSVSSRRSRDRREASFLFLYMVVGWLLHSHTEGSHACVIGGVARLRAYHSGDASSYGI